MKLSPKQNEVIRLMSEGWEICTRKNEHFGKAGQLVYSSRTYYLADPNSDTEKKIHHSTFLSLVSAGVINKEKPFNLLINL